MNFLLDIFFPKICVGCGKHGEDICNECFRKIKIRKIQQCPHCRKENAEGKFCSDYCKKDYVFDQLIVCADYSQIKNLIIKFKYKFSKDLINVFNKLLEAELKSYTKILPGEKMVIPAPIHKRNFKKRGFNQALLLGKAITQIIPNTKLVDCLSEKESRGQQAKLDRSHRLKNLKNSIEIRHHPPLKNILLVDDIVTTGSTLNECSRVLKEAGASHITAIVLARN
ncbi:MAG: ComF family protein [Nitrospirota bacterium]